MGLFDSDLKLERLIENMKRITTKKLIMECIINLKTVIQTRRVEKKKLIWLLKTRKQNMKDVLK